MANGEHCSNNHSALRDRKNYDPVFTDKQTRLGKVTVAFTFLTRDFGLGRDLLWPTEEVKKWQRARSEPILLEAVGAPTCLLLLCIRWDPRVASGQARPRSAEPPQTVFRCMRKKCLFPETKGQMLSDATYEISGLGRFIEPEVD